MYYFREHFCFEDPILKSIFKPVMYAECERKEDAGGDGTSDCWLKQFSQVILKTSSQKNELQPD